MDRKMLLVGLGSFLFLALIGAGVFAFAKPAEFRGTAYVEPYPPAPEIDLARSDGSRFNLSALRGNVVLLFFGYTTCPDVCPATLAEIKLALAELDVEESGRVQVVFVTVDPERDSPADVQEYVSRFNPAFIGLGGEQVELEAVWSAYGIYREVVQGASAAGYLINHTARVTLIDQNGDMRVSYGFDTPVEDIVHDLKMVLDQ